MHTGMLFVPKHNTHAPAEDKDDEMKNSSYDILHRVCQYYIVIVVVGDMNTIPVRDSVIRNKDKYSLYKKSHGYIVL